ncbi:host cell division inhibitor Icd-like protein [Providencia sp. Je.9.19]|uniref:host cell division inhibitor Icd-like protein n=1 Tax=Providencia sp. Je.9.19 TaxID=3142844 RepID=UPI003DA80444
MRILNCGDCPSPLGLLSRFTVDKWSPIGLILISIGGHLNTVKPIKSTPPNNATNTIRGLITNDRLFIEVTMSKHNTPVTGRTSLTPNQSYRWLFLALNRSDYTAKPCRIAVTAPNENSARLMLVRDYMLIFAGRLPAIGGKHHA